MIGIFPTLWWTSASIAGNVTLVETKGLFKTHDPKITYIFNFSATYNVYQNSRFNTLENENVL